MDSGECPESRWSSRPGSLQIEVNLQSTIQEKLPYTMTVRGLLTGGSVMVHRLRAFAVTNGMVRGVTSVMATGLSLVIMLLPGQRGMAELSTDKLSILCAAVMAFSWAWLSDHTNMKVAQCQTENF